jgi:hypothetical protein
LCGLAHPHTIVEGARLFKWWECAQCDAQPVRMPWVNSNPEKPFCPPRTRLPCSPRRRLLTINCCQQTFDYWLNLVPWRPLR